MKCVGQRLYNQIRVTQKASGSETFDPFLDELSCSFLLSGSLEELHFSLFCSFPLYSIRALKSMLRRH